MDGGGSSCCSDGVPLRVYYLSNTGKIFVDRKRLILLYF